MKLHKLTLKDKKTFNKFLNLRPHALCVYSFADIYIWKGLFDIYWQAIEGSLCVFFKDKIGCFLYLPPLGKTIEPGPVGKAFQIMDEFNKNTEVSRIENVEEDELGFFKNLRFPYVFKSYDYLCLRGDLANLRGNKFKSKRACVNYFTKNYPFEYLPFSIRHRQGCLALFEDWACQRKLNNQDPIYQGMLLDSLTSLKILLKDYRDLGISGRVVKIEGKIKAFTFGFKLNTQIFCVLYEITDLAFKGLAQFIFRRFCAELKDYPYINVMDDSGLENLKKVKLSYKPVKLIPSYIIKRNG